MKWVHMSWRMKGFLTQRLARISTKNFEAHGEQTSPRLSDTW